MTTPVSIGLRINGATRPASDGAWAIRKNPVTGDVVLAWEDPVVGTRSTTLAGRTFAILRRSQSR